jgi:hypothetical protein
MVPPPELRRPIIGFPNSKGAGAIAVDEIRNQAAWFAGTSMSSMPSLNLTAPIIFGKRFVPFRRRRVFDAAMMELLLKVADLHTGGGGGEGLQEHRPLRQSRRDYLPRG